MVLPWRITALIFVLLPALAQPAAAGEFSAEEQKLVADIRQKMDQTTQLLIYAYENEEKMDLAEMRRVLAGFSDLADWLGKKIPYRTFERRTGSYCAGAGGSVWIYWSDTVSYYRFRGDDYAKYTGAALTLESLRERQKRSLEGHFFGFQQCYIHLDQVPTRLEDKENAPKISITAMPSIRSNSLKIVKDIEIKMITHNVGDFLRLIKRADALYKNYYSISNLKIVEGGSPLCENFVDFPKHFIENYILRHGKSSKNQKLPDYLFKIGYDGLLHNYYRDVKLCDNFVKEYKRKSP